MDGNGRWAASRAAAAHRRPPRGRPRRPPQHRGGHPHRRGWLTLYAFSSENWRRPVSEVLDLTGLLRHYLRTEIAELKANGVRLRIIGEPARFDPDIQRDLVEAETRHRGQHQAEPDRRAVLWRAGRDRRAPPARRPRPCRPARLDPAALDEDRLSGFLATAGMPDPDLIIRTSGEQRLSNFLLWQAAYAELVFLDVLWPDFGAEHFAAALAEYARRERRFGARPG